MEDVKSFLEKYGLLSYSEDFEENGYDDLDVLLSLSESDLNEAMNQIGITKPGHRVKLKNILKIEKSKKESPLQTDIASGSGMNTSTSKTVESSSQKCK